MIDIEDLIPHRAPIKIITEVIEVSEKGGSAAGTVNENWPLCDEKGVRTLILIEAIAQTAAIVEGCRRKKIGKDGVKGWLVGIKSAEFTKDYLPLGARITARVKTLYEFNKYGVIEGVVKLDDEILLKATLQFVRLNEDI